MSDTETENLINLSVEDTKQIPNKSDNILPAPLPLIASPEGRLSLENNPFDLVQKLSICRQDDPFEVVEKEASLKARQSFSRTSNEVKVGNLLSLSGDNESFGMASVLSNGTIYQSAEDNDLENESPPLTVSTKWTPDSLTADSGGTGFSCDSSDSSSKQSNSIRNRKIRQHRNRLLKISITNSTYSTPMSSRKSNDDEVKEINIFDTDSQSEEHMLASESPLKAMFEDIMSEQQPATYTEKDFDADLEMMNIPMLNHVASSCDAANEQLPSSQHKKNEAVDPQNSALPNIESLRLKLRAKQSEPNSNHDIQDLINNLKSVIRESNKVDEQKKDKLGDLIEILSSELNTVALNSKEPVPEPIKRQGTFNFDEQENNAHQNDEVVDSVKANEVIDLNHIKGSQQQQPIEEIPDIMVRSSATYDGETAEDKEYLNLPQIDPPSPPKEQSLHPNLNDIIEQIQYFFEQHQIESSKQAEDNNSTQTNGPSAIASNPTFIVVMPTISHEDSKIFSENSEFSTSMRRRSQSLSIHDKLKIVQLPIKSSMDTKSTDIYESPPLSAANTSTVNIGDLDFKTPARFLPRRNSFSSTSPYTPMRYSRLNNSTLDKGRFNGSESMSQRIASPVRSRSIMETHNESIYTQPHTRPQLGLMKPDPKKKVKTTSSVVKSNGPLKATIPVKKVAPNIKANTSMHLVAKSGYMSNTSTPMPDVRSNDLKILDKTIPSAWSTPTVPVSSPGKHATHLARYSNLSTTPIRKSLAVPTTSTAGLRRRTLSEFGAKSPVKTRTSVSASGVSNSSALSKSNTTRSIPLRPTNNSKTSLQTRSSINGTSTYLTNRNKENKQR